MDGLNLLLDGLEQVDHPAVHGIALALFLVLLSELLHVDGKTVLFWVAAIKQQLADGCLFVPAASTLILRRFCCLMILFFCIWSKVFLAGAENFLDSFVIFERHVFLVIISLYPFLLPLTIIPTNRRMRHVPTRKLHLALLGKMHAAIRGGGLMLKEIRVERIPDCLWRKDYVLLAERTGLFVLEMQGIGVAVLF